MPKESIIRIFRSDTASAVPSLTAGEIAVNIPDQRLFVGNSTGGVIPFFGNGVTGVNGITGGVSITSGSGITITQTGKQITVASSITQYTAPLATSSVTGVASFPNADFSVSAVGAVSLTGNVARTHVGQSFSGLQVFSSGLSANGLTGTILTPSQTNITALGTLTSLNTAGITSTQRVTISAGGLSVAGNIDGTIGTAAQPNITSLGTLTSLNTAGMTSTQRVTISSGGLSVAGNIDGTIGTAAQPNITSLGTLTSLNTAGMTSTQRVTISSGGLSVAGNIDGTIGTAAQPNITSLGSLTTLTTAGLTSTQRVNVSAGGIVVQAGGLSVTGGSTLTGGSLFFGDIEVYDGAFIRTGGLSVTGGIAGTLVTPAQTNITSVGTLTSLTTSGLLTAQALNVVAGATFGADIYAPNMVTGVNGITGAVSLTSGSNITITQSGKQITIAGSAGGVTWSVVTADQTLTNNTGSFANKSSGTLALTLPTTAAVGTTIRVSGMQNAWRLAQNASQKINFGRFSTTTGTGGYIESTDARDSVELVCCVANTEWNVVSSIGNMTIV